MAIDNARWAYHRDEINRYYFAYDLDLKHGPPPERFLSTREMMDMVNRQISEDGSRTYAGIMRDKFLFSLVSKSLGYPSPQPIAFLDQAGVEWLDPRHKGSYDTFALRAGELDGFVKPLKGDGGDGAHALKVQDGQIVLDGAEIEPDAVRRVLKGRSVLQERVRQHAALSVLHPSSLNTMRLVTTLRDGAAAPLGAVLRVGAGGLNVDSWSQGGLIVAVDLDEGVLGEYGLFKPRERGEAAYGSMATEHPDTGVSFRGFALPSFHDAVEVACGFHRDLGHLRSVGWDIAFTPDGPTVIEGNTHWNGSMLMAFDPTFKSRYLAAVGA